MAKEKKSFVLYCDIIHTIEKLNDEQAGALFKHILLYVNDQNPTPKDIITEIAFEPIKQSLKRDLKKFENIKESRSEAGKRGASKRWQTMAKDSKQIAKDGKPKQDVTNMAVSVSVSDSVINNNTINGIYRAFAHLQLTNEHFDTLQKDGWSKKQIDAVLDEVENFKGNSKYKSLYLTCKNWLDRKYPKPSQKVTQDVKQSIENGILKIANDVD